MLQLEQIPMLKDNYSYALIFNEQVIIIDPSDPDQSLAFFAERPTLKLTAILNTHSHHDHIGGNEALWQQWRCPIFGPRKEKNKIPHLSNALEDKEIITLLGVKITAHDVGAHTIGHMAYFVDKKADIVIKHGHSLEQFIAHHLADHKMLFVGDSLFAAGCGKLFEGTPQDLLNVLRFYQAQDPTTLMVCAHEYTASNLCFAQWILPDNEAINVRAKKITRLLDSEGSSIPCLFSEEFTTNPFLLALHDPERSAIAKKLSVDKKNLPTLIGALRTAKDNF